MKTSMGVLSGFNNNADPIIFDFSALLYGLSYVLIGYRRRSLLALLPLLIIFLLNPLASLIGFLASGFYFSWTVNPKRCRLSMFVGLMLLSSSTMPFFKSVEKNQNILFFGDENLKRHSSVYHIPEQDFEKSFISVESFLRAGGWEVFKTHLLEAKQTFDQVWVVSESLEFEKAEIILDWVKNGNTAVFIVKPNLWNLMLLSKLLPQTDFSISRIFRTDSIRQMFSISSIKFKEGDTIWDIKRSFQPFPEISELTLSVTSELTPLNMTLSNGIISFVPNGDKIHASTPIIRKIGVGEGDLYLFSNPATLSSGRIYGKLASFFMVLNFIENGENIFICYIVGFFCSFLFFLISTVFSKRYFLFAALFSILYPKLILFSSTKDIICSPHTASVRTQHEENNSIVRDELARSSITVICEGDELLLFFAKRHFVSKQYEDGIFLSNLEKGTIFTFDERNLPTKSDFARTVRSCGD